MTISDRKKGIADPLNAALIKFFEPVMLSGTDYYPFGMAMRVGGENKYKYGFNGKENDNEVKGGDGLQQDFTARAYDPRIGRWFATDEMIKPHLTPYNFVQNNPANNIDPDGKDDIHFHFVTKVVAYTIGAGSSACSTVYKNVTTARVEIVKTNGPDRFYHHKHFVAANGMTSEKIKEFHPFVASARSGLTTTEIPFTFGLLNKDDRDIHTLSKYYDAFPAFKSYLDDRLKGPVDGTGNSSNYTELFLPNREHYNSAGNVVKTAETVAAVASVVDLGLGAFQLYRSGGLWLEGAAYGSDKATVKSFNNVVPKKGWFDVVVHGDSKYPGMLFNADGQVFNAETLFKMMQESGFKEGMKIRLISCNGGLGGAGSAAQELSNISNTTVISPAARTKVGEFGKLITEDNSKYKVFKTNP